MVPDLYFVGIRSVLPVPALLSATARDGWPSGWAARGRPCQLAGQNRGLASLGPVAQDPSRAGLEIQRRVEITQASVTRSEKFVVMRQV